MLQSEFFERTKVNLTNEEYLKVEEIYDHVKMDKDEFCKLWLKNRDNKIIEELMDTIRQITKDGAQLLAEYSDLEKKLDGQKKLMDDELKAMSDSCRRHLDDFGKKMVINFEDDVYRYDNICEEFGLGFICKTKLENDIELNKSERDFLVAKL